MLGCAALYLTVRYYGAAASPVAPMVDSSDDNSNRSVVSDTGKAEVMPVKKKSEVPRFIWYKGATR